MSDRSPLRGSKAALRKAVAPRMQWLRQARLELFGAPLEPVLHPSRWRLKWVGIFIMVGNPVFGGIWWAVLPQPWESMWLRAAVSLMGVPLLMDRWTVDQPLRFVHRMFSVICWAQLPVLFSWMYLCNGGNMVWLSSVVAMILIYYHVTDWRLATIGMFSGGFVAWLLMELIQPQAVPFTDETRAVGAVVVVFAWSAAIALGFSSANLRREHLQHTLTTMGIMAHELRTPLATMALMGDALSNQAQAQPDAPGSAQLGKLAQRMQGLVRNMHHQIDTQIVNARLMRMPQHGGTLWAAETLREIVQNYPYRSERERRAVELHVRRDFCFRASGLLFGQVLDNLLKNALKAMAASSQPANPGDLRIEVGVLHGRGQILVIDKGIGIEPALQSRIFEPFFSTDRGTGHGLGLAFCRRAIDSLGGSIRVASRPGQGATFTIELPMADPAADPPPDERFEA